MEASSAEPRAFCPQTLQEIKRSTTSSKIIQMMDTPMPQDTAAGCKPDQDVKKHDKNDADAV